jgi:hypothetical protein
MDEKGLVALVVVAIVLLGAPLIIGSSYSNLEGQEYFAENETFEPNSSAYVTLDAAHLDASRAYNQTVYNATGYPMVEDVDYRWNATKPSIKAIEGTDFANDSTASVTYTFKAPSEAARNSLGALSNVYAAGSVVIVLVGVGLVLAVVAKFNTRGKY